MGGRPISGVNLSTKVVSSQQKTAIVTNKQNAAVSLKTVATQQQTSNVHGQDNLKPASNQTTTQLASALTTEPKNASSLSAKKEMPTIDSSQKSESFSLNEDTKLFNAKEDDITIVLPDKLPTDDKQTCGFKLLINGELYTPTDIPKDLQSKPKIKAFLDSVKGNNVKMKKNGLFSKSQLKIGSNVYLNATTGEVKNKPSTLFSGIMKRIQRFRGKDSTTKVAGVKMLTTADKISMKNKFKATIEKCNFSDIKQVSVLKKQATELNSLNSDLNSNETDLTQLKVGVKQTIQEFKSQLTTKSTASIETKIKAHDEIQGKLDFLTHVDKDDSSVQESNTSFTALKPQFKDLKVISELKNNLVSSCKSELAGKILDTKIQENLNKESISEVKSGLTELTNDFESVKDNIEKKEAEFNQFKDETKSLTSEVAQDARQSILNNIENQTELSGLNAKISDNFVGDNSKEKQLNIIEKKETSFKERIDQSSLSKQEKAELKQSFLTEAKQTPSLEEKIKVLDNARLNLTKTVASKTQVLMNDLKSTTKKTLASYTGNSTSVKFKETLSDYKTTFSKRFNYIKKKAMSTELALEKSVTMQDGVKEKTKSAGSQSLKKLTGINYNPALKHPESLDSVQRGKVADKEDTINDIKDLYLEKKFGKLYQTQMGSQYNDVSFEKEIDNKIKDKISELTDGVLDARQNQDKIKDNLKTSFDDVYGGALDQVSDFSGQEASGLIVGSFSKDAIYANLRGVEETVDGFEAVQNEMLEKAQQTSDSDGTQLEDLINLSDTMKSFESFSSQYVRGKDADVKMDKEHLEDLFNGACSNEQLDMSKDELNEFKAIFLDYTETRLQDKGITDSESLFKQGVKEDTIKKFELRHATDHTKLRTETDSAGIYKQNFSAKEGNPKFKTAFKKIHKNFEKKLKLRCQIANISGSVIQQQASLEKGLKKSKSTAGEALGNVKLKLQTTKIKFSQSSLTEKIKMLKDIKSDFKKSLEEIKNVDKAKADAKEVKLFTQAQDALDEVNKQLDTIDDIVKQSGDAIGQVGAHVDKLETSMNRAINSMGLEGNSSTDSNMAKSEAVKASVAGINLKGIGRDAQKVMSGLAKGIQHGVGAGADVLDTALTELGTIQEQAANLVASAKDISEQVGVGLDVVMGAIELAVPGGKETLALIDIALDVKNIYNTTQEINQFREDLTAVSDMKNFITASEVNENKDVQDRISTFHNLMKSKDQRSKASVDLAVRVLNLVSPPQVAVGTVLNKVIKVCQMPDLDDDQLKQIATDVNTINDGFSNLTASDAGDLKVAQEKSTNEFLKMLNSANQDQVEEKWDVVSSETSLKKGVVVKSEKDNKTYKKHLGYHDLAKSYQGFAYTMASSDQVSVGLRSNLESRRK